MEMMAVITQHVHTLRAAFNTRLIGKIDQDLREFWMGHAIGAVARAYLNMPTEDMRQLYMATAETYLKIEMTSREEHRRNSKRKRHGNNAVGRKG